MEAAAAAKKASEEATAAELELATARARAEAAGHAVTVAEARIADFAPERLLSRFVADRAASEEYGRELGLPTRIRRDLDTLRVYLVDLTKASAASRRADRIVLFIDDLDRCAPGVVVKVLEAVHILLASDLFIVVVGVDVRWLTQALATHHAGQFIGNEVLNPEEFLEKIFQVPFWIPAMSTEGSRAIVSDALPEVQREKQGTSGFAEDSQSQQDGSAHGEREAREVGSSGSRDEQSAPLPTLEPVQLSTAEHAALLRWGASARRHASSAQTIRPFLSDSAC